MKPAKVTSTSPLEVQLAEASTSVPAQRKASALPTLAVGDDVLVEVIERRLHVLFKVIAA